MRIEYSFKMHGLAIVLAAVLAIAVPEYARADESGFKGFYFKFEGRGNFAAGDEAPWAMTVSDRTIHSIGLDETGSFRIGSGVRFGNVWDFGLLYSGLQVDANKSLGLSGVYNYANLNSCSFCNGGYYHTNLSGTEARSNFAYDVIDFEAGYTLNLGPANVRFIAGIRTAFLEHTVDAFYTEGGDTFVVKRIVDQWGVGPRVGVEGLLPLGSSGLHLTAAGNGSVMFGERERTDTLKGDVAFASIPIPIMVDSQTTYNANAELGIGYGVEMGNDNSILIILGYRGEAWWDVTDTATTGPIKLGDSDEDQFFHGPFLRGTFNFR